MADDKMKDINNGLEEETDEPILFEDEDGNVHEFFDIAFIEHKGKEYYALVPADFDPEAEIPEDEEEGAELYFAEISEDAEGYEELEMVVDETLFGELFDEFMKLKDEDEE